MKKKLHSLNVLCIDDVSVNLMVLTRTLKFLGVHYEIADSGTKGLWCLQQRGYDAAFIDIMMPQISGWDVIRAIRHDKRTCQMMAIAITADSGISAEKFANHRFDSYIYKPIDTVNFQSIIRLLTKLHEQKMRVGS